MHTLPAEAGTPCDDGTTAATNASSMSSMSSMKLCLSISSKSYRRSFTGYSLGRKNGTTPSNRSNVYRVSRQDADYSLFFSHQLEIKSKNMSMSKIKRREPGLNSTA